MPLYQNIQTEQYQLFVWQYQAHEQEILDDFAQNKAHLQNYSGKKRIEKILKEFLIAQYAPKQQLAYHANGQPYFVSGELCLSISHAYPMVALALSKHPIGIDVEKKQERFIALQSRFCSEEERHHPSDVITDLCRVWCTKEALYKADERKLWSFTQNYKIINPQQALVFDEKESKTYHTQCFDWGEFMLVLAQLAQN